MRLSYLWLSELVENLPGVDEVAERLTMGGIEVEAIERPQIDYGDTLAAALIEDMNPHPDADRLTVCTVNDGASERRTIVCGARNMKAGDTVVLARPGCVLPSGMQIRKSKLRGVTSEGMLCSAGELGLPESGEGILILEKGISPGTAAAPLLGLDDTILELGITPNRGDCLNLFGLARETAALCGLKLRAPAAPMAIPTGRSEFSVEIEDADACPLYHGLVLGGVKVGPSPTWLRTRLAACGIRSINNVVDVTNFVLMERGQPLHAFDMARLEGDRLSVRLARSGEKIQTLDGREVALLEEDLVIADSAVPVAMAGVMGGEASAVSDQTTDVFLESAMFAPAKVRRTSRRHGLITDSSYRFERGVDAEGVKSALLRAATLLAEVAGASAKGSIVQAGNSPKPAAPLIVRTARVNALLGLNLSADRVESVLASVGAEPKSVMDGFEASPPSHRQDLTREIDFVEEVARIVGYDQIAPAMPLVVLTPTALPTAVRVARDLRVLLAGLGLHEHVTVSFAPEADNERYPGLFCDESNVIVRNPLRADANVLQKSALGGLMRALEANVAVQQPRVDLFTIARTFAAATDGSPVQREVVSGVLFGDRLGVAPGQSRALTFPDLKAVVEKVLGILAPGDLPEYVPAPGRPEFHPRAAAEVRLDGKRVGVLGRLHPDVAEELEIAGETYLFEVDCRLAVAYRRAHPGLQAIPRYPSSERDVSLLVDAEVLAGAATKAIEELGDPNVESVAVFDEYTGKGIEQDRKALGYRLVYRAADRTLTDAEVAALHERVVGHLTERLGAQVRV